MKAVVPTPTLVVPNPTRTPWSPKKFLTLTSSSVVVGGPIRTTGGLDWLYPDPWLETAIPVTTPPLIVAVPIAVDVDPTPTAVLATLTLGVAAYPTPPSDITNDDIVPAVETTAVAAAATLVPDGLTNLTLSWNVRIAVLSSFLGLKNGLTLCK